MPGLEGVYFYSLDVSLHACFFARSSCRLYEYNTSFYFAIPNCISRRIMVSLIIVVQGLFSFDWAHDNTLGISRGRSA